MLRLSKEVLDLETENTKLDFDTYYVDTISADPNLDDVLIQYQDLMASKAENGGNSVPFEHAIDVLNKGMLTVYYLMQQQYEISRLEEFNPAGDE